MSKRIAMIGTGYVGLVNGVGLADFGNYVTCADIDTNKIDMLKKNQIPIYEPGLQEYFERNVKMGRLSFSDDIDQTIQENEIIFIAVNTPFVENKGTDLSYVESVGRRIAKNLNNYKVIVTKSTVPVGTNRWLKELITKESGNTNFDVVSNPEFLREGKAVYDFFHPDRVVIGCESERAQEMLKDIYRALYLIETPFVFCGFETAELIKYSSNAFLATKITFINQIANLCESVGGDIHLVSKAIGMDKRIGSKFLHPGPGYGGSCFPKDTRALVEIGEKYNVEMSLVGEVIRINEQQKIRMVQKLEDSLGDLTGKTIAVLGLAFKAETDDIRESPAVAIINELLNRKALVAAHDPQANNNAKLIFGEKVKFCDDKYEAVKNADTLIIVTEWNEYRSLDLGKIKLLMQGDIILDTRNLLAPAEVEQAGFKYVGVGR